MKLAAYPGLSGPLVEVDRRTYGDVGGGDRPGAGPALNSASQPEDATNNTALIDVTRDSGQKVAWEVSFNLLKTVFRSASLAAVGVGLALIVFFAVQNFTGAASGNAAGGLGNVAPPTEDTGDNSAGGLEDETLELTVPKISIENMTVPTAVPGEQALRDNAAVRLPSTGLPWEEEANVYIAGHELGYPFTPSFRAFYDLKKLEEGDEIYITDADGREYAYEVFEVLIVQPTDLWVLEPLGGRNIVSLQVSETQQQVGDITPKRVVRAELVDVTG
ncbi:MAG: class E sortase [Actinomycetota bacterium]|nr:class E sortase [Actinomycetota bacterium]